MNTRRTLRIPQFLLTLLLFTACQYGEEQPALYDVGDNFTLVADSLVLQASQPLHNMPVDTTGGLFLVMRGDPLVVAETTVISEDSIDSVWVKLARDQYTMGWTHGRDFLASVVPDDPISRIIHQFGSRQTDISALLLAMLLPFLYRMLRNRKNMRVFPLRDIPSPYPTLLLSVLSAATVLHGCIQSYAWQTWLLYYHHPTLNPFGLPPVLSLFLCLAWILLVLAIATVSEAFRLLRTSEALAYLLSLLGCCAACYLLFSFTASCPPAGCLLLCLVLIPLLTHYFRHSRPFFICGSCGARLRELGKCPCCGADNR